MPPAQPLNPLADAAGKPVSDIAQPKEVPNPAAQKKCPLHALVIGINAYAVGPLKGAVADATRFLGYLKKDLGVPDSQITFLLDDKAKRQDIIDAFKKLAKPDNGIEPGDPIVIYYAGHGSEGRPPPERKENGKVQSIVPQDSSVRNRVTSIPDYVLGKLLWDISKTKDNNITVILDCCHSASGTRDPEGARYLAPENLPEFPDGLDSDILNAAEATSESGEEKNPASLGLAYPDMSSHVLLAACGHRELAWERDGNGKFTAALLDLLEGRDIASVTYKWCMQHLPKLETDVPQNPVCEGKYIDRVFFNSKVPGANASLILIKTDTQGVYLQAGSAQGVAPGSRFEVYKSDVLGDNNPPLGKLEVEFVEAFRSRLKWVDGCNASLGELSYGRLVAYGLEQVMKLFVTPDFWSATTGATSDEWLRPFSGTQTTVPVVLVDHPKKSNLIMSYDSESKLVTFTTTHPAALRYKVEKLPATDIKPEPDPVRVILASLSRWNWHVGRFPGFRPFQNSVTMELFKLEKTNLHTKEGGAILKPTGDNLNVNGVADIVVGSKTDPPYGQDPYGFKIRNTSSRELYAYMFQFGISDQSITARFTKVLPSGSGRADPNLPRGVPLTLGYGSSGELPMINTLKGKDINVSIFKLFVTTKPTDFENIAQLSPFVSPDSREDRSDAEKADMLNMDLWDTFEMILVERRVPRTDEGPTGDGTAEKPVIEPVTENNPISSRANSKADNSVTWFDTPPFTAENLPSKGCNMRLRTYGHSEFKHRGPGGSVPDGEGWFEIAVLDSDEYIKDSPDEEPLVYRSHTAPNEEFDSWTNGTVFEPEHVLWKSLEAGDRLRVIVKAKGKGWANIAKEGELNFW